MIYGYPRHNELRFSTSTESVSFPNKLTELTHHSISRVTDTQMTLPLSNRYDDHEVPTFKSLCVKFHGITISQKKRQPLM